jgi:hypothetical protein
MAYRQTPVVAAGYLYLDDGERVALDTPAWFTWVQQARSFSYGSPQTPYRFTVRREKRRHTYYWYAYLKFDAKLHNSYLGRSAGLTQARLDEVGQQLADKVRAARHQP